MRAYCVWLIGGAVAICLVNAAIVFAIDPHNRLGRNSSGVYDWVERQHTAAAIQRVPHNAAFFSNSKLFMVNPAKLERFDWFNGAFGAANVEEIVGYLDAFVEDQRVVVVAVDFWGFHADSPGVAEPGLPEAARESLFHYLFNSAMLHRGLMTLWHRSKGKAPLILPGGYINPEVYQAKLDRLLANPNWRMMVEFGDQEFDATFRLAHERIEMLAAVRDRLEAHGVLFVLVLHPQHPGLLRRLESETLAPHFDQFRHAILAEFPEAIDLSEAYPDSSAYIAGDPMHYRPEIAVEFFNERVIPEIERRFARQKKSRRRPKAAAARDSKPDDQAVAGEEVRPR